MNDDPQEDIIIPAEYLSFIFLEIKMFIFYVNNRNSFDEMIM